MSRGSRKIALEDFPPCYSWHNKGAYDMTVKRSAANLDDACRKPVRTAVDCSIANCSRQIEAAMYVRGRPIMGTRTVESLDNSESSGGNISNAKSRGLDAAF